MNVFREKQKKKNMVVIEVVETEKQCGCRVGWWGGICVFNFENRYLWKTGRRAQETR